MMLARVSVFAGCLCSIASSFSVGQSQVKIDGRTVVIHNPGQSGPLPLVVGLHGWYGSATDKGSFCGTGQIAKHASSLGFIGVCPDGKGDPDGEGSWNAAGCCGAAVDAKIDDVKFLRDVVAYMKEHASVSKVYAMGLSNGAMMSWRLGCEANDLFDGVAPFSGGWYGSPAFNVIGSHAVPNGWHTSKFSCSRGDNASNAVACSSCYDYASHSSDRKCWKPNTYSCTAPPANYPIMYTHGEADDEEPYALVTADFKHYAQEVLGCQRLGTSPAYTEGKAKCFEYASCAQGRRVAFCSVKGMGHQMPGNKQAFDGVRAAWSWIHGGWPSDDAAALV